MNKETKLVLSDVIDIRRLHSIGTTSEQLARKFGISVRHVNNIVAGNKWKDVPLDRIVKGFSNYAITPDGRVWSFTKNAYLEQDRISSVRLQKTTKSGVVRKRVSLEKLMKSHF